MIALTIVILVLALPAGFLIAHLARDELVVGRKWFKRLMALSVILGVIFTVIGEYVAALSCIFILICTLISYILSFDKTWTRKRI